MHINVLELRAATYALKALLRHLQLVPKHSRLRVDNTTAVVYIKERGETRLIALTSQGLELWAVALEAEVFLTAQHIRKIWNAGL